MIIIQLQILFINVVNHVVKDKPTVVVLYMYYAFAESSAESQLVLDSGEEIVTTDSPPRDQRISNAEWAGFKIVGDNIDKTVRPRHLRFERQAKSLHYFHAYAVKDRVNLVDVSDIPPVPPQSPDLLSLLPSSDDITEIRHLFEVHVARIVVEHIPFMKAAFSDVVDQHIFHEFYEEMRTKSDVVSCYIITVTLQSHVHA